MDRPGIQNKQPCADLKDPTEVQTELTRIRADDFWPWAFDDFLTNSLRGVLAEYIVACATGCTLKKRTEWDAFDLITDKGIKIEVKSSAYLQSWVQKRLSVIRFDIAPKKGLDAQTNRYSTHSIRSADVYVFCLFKETERVRADPLELDQWIFRVCSTRLLSQRFGLQKSIGLSGLDSLGIEQISFYDLNNRIAKASASPTHD